MFNFFIAIFVGIVLYTNGVRLSDFKSITNISSKKYNVRTYVISNQTVTESKRVKYYSYLDNRRKVAYNNNEIKNNITWE